jgi:hypothetical protein
MLLLPFIFRQKVETETKRRGEDRGEAISVSFFSLFSGKPG